MHIKAFEEMKNGALECNIKFMIEGEEEVGSDHLEDFVKSNKEKLKCDIILISDTGMIAQDIPSITTGLRGLSYMEVTVTGPNRDLHSGLYGGSVQNPINVVCDMISQLHDKDKKITIPGFYDKVIEISNDERLEMNKALFDAEEFKNSIGIDHVSGEKGYNTEERRSIRPTLDVNEFGVVILEKELNSNSSKAHAKISMRLVPDQDWKKLVNYSVTILNLLHQREK